MWRQSNAWNKITQTGKPRVRNLPISLGKRFSSNGKKEKGVNSKDELSNDDSRKALEDRTKELAKHNGDVPDEVLEVDVDRSVMNPLRKSILVPRVAPTEYMPTRDVQMEGLYAGYRPLFLGNSPVRGGRKHSALDNFFSSFANLNLTDGSQSSKNVSVNDIIEDLKQNNAGDNLENRGERIRKPIIPWDASISGMVYGDHSFKDVPRNVVSRLKPFKMVRVEKKSDNKKEEKGTNMIRMKVHNLEINDETEMVDLSHGCYTRKSNNMFDRNDSTKEGALNAQKNYERELSDYTYKHKFIKSDQRIFKTDAEKINRLLTKEFHKQTGLTINSEFSKNSLPLYIYVDKSISAKILFRRFLRKRLLEHIQPVLATLMSSYDTKDHGEKFRSKINLKISNTVRELSEYLPSVYFTGNSVDCILHSSPISGFRRIHWLKPHKRRCIFWGKNIDMDYFFHLNGEYNVTRGGVKHMKYPINLHWKTFDAAFSEWDYFA